MSELLTFLSVTGAAALCAALAVGGYQLARWGWAGQTFLWGIRHEIDRAVQKELQETIKAEAQ